MTWFHAAVYAPAVIAAVAVAAGRRRGGFVEIAAKDLIGQIVFEVLSTSVPVGLENAMRELSDELLEPSIESTR